MTPDIRKLEQLMERVIHAARAAGEFGEKALASEPRGPLTDKLIRHYLSDLVELYGAALQEACSIIQKELPEDNAALMTFTREIGA